MALGWISYSPGHWCLPLIWSKSFRIRPDKTLSTLFTFSLPRKIWTNTVHVFKVFFNPIRVRHYVNPPGRRLFAVWGALAVLNTIPITRIKKQNFINAVYSRLFGSEYKVKSPNPSKSGGGLTATTTTLNPRRID